MNKSDREFIWNKYDKKCAYCGKSLEYNKMQVDHIEPLFRNDSDEVVEKFGRKKGSNDMDNLNPSCARCNRWKSTYTLEQFRNEISLQSERLKKYNNQYRMILDFNMVIETNNEIEFWFEKYNKLGLY